MPFVEGEENEEKKEGGGRGGKGGEGGGRKEEEYGGCSYVLILIRSLESNPLTTTEKLTDITTLEKMYLDVKYRIGIYRRTIY